MKHTRVIALALILALFAACMPEAVKADNSAPRSQSPRAVWRANEGRAYSFQALPSSHGSEDKKQTRAQHMAYCAIVRWFARLRESAPGLMPKPAHTRRTPAARLIQCLVSHPHQAPPHNT